jgi:hypothetical protein
MTACLARGMRAARGTAGRPPHGTRVAIYDQLGPPTSRRIAGTDLRRQPGRVRALRHRARQAAAPRSGEHRRHRPPRRCRAAPYVVPSTCTPCRDRARGSVAGGSRRTSPRTPAPTRRGDRAKRRAARRKHPTSGRCSPGRPATARGSPPAAGRETRGRGTGSSFRRPVRMCSRRRRPRPRRAGEDRDPLAPMYAKGDQPTGDLANGCGQLGVRELDPPPIAPEAQSAAFMQRGALKDHLGQHVRTSSPADGWSCVDSSRDCHGCDGLRSIVQPDHAARCAGRHPGEPALSAMSPAIHRNRGQAIRNDPHQRPGI